MMGMQPSCLCPKRIAHQCICAICEANFLIRESLVSNLRRGKSRLDRVPSHFLSIYQHHLHTKVLDSVCPPNVT